MGGFSVAAAVRFLAALLATMWIAALAATPGAAFTMDMEGFAPAGGSTDELATNPPDFGVSIQGAFKLSVAHGHYYSATNPNTWATSDIGGSASDWFLHDHDQPMLIEEVSGSPFSITSFQAGEWFGPFAGNPAQVSTTGNSIDVTGYLFGGGTITTTFVSDAIPSDGFGPNVDFETFTFGAGWSNLTAVEFLVPPPNDDNRQFGYDNIVVDVVPEPSSVLLVGLGLLGIGIRRRGF